MQVIDISTSKVGRQPVPGNSWGNRQAKRLWGCLYFLFFITFFISGCASTREVHVNKVTPDQDVPTHLIADYVDQMRYLAMSAGGLGRKEKLKRLDDIDRKIEEAKAMLEEYRKLYGFRD
jgi:hypothetical protein